MLLPLLPGLYVAGVTLAFAALLRRAREPLPWRFVLATLVLVLAVFAPVLFGGQVLLPLDNLRAYAPFGKLPAPAVHGNHLQGDLVTLIAPAQARLRAALAAGEWGLWNPLVGTGAPLLADPQTQAYQPLQLLALPFPLATAAAVVAALRVLVATLFTFLFLRRQRLGDGAAFAGALAWGLGGFLLLWLGWPLANVGALLPALLWAIARALDGGSRGDLCIVLLATLALALGGHPEAELYAGALAVFFALARARELAPRVGPRMARTRLLRLAAAGALGALLALPLWLPATHAAARSERAEGLRARRHAPAGPTRVAAPEWEGGWATFAVGRLVPLVAPNAFGNSRYAHYWGPENTNEDASGFVGSATLLLALVGAAASFGRRAREHMRPQERLLQVAVVASLLLVALPPALRPWADRLPLALQSASYYHRLLLLVGFGLACLAACELDRVIAGEGRPWPWVVGAAVALAALVAWATLAHAPPQGPDPLAVLRLGFLRWHLRFLAAAVVVLLALRRRWWAGPVAAALVAAELLLVHASANPSMPPALAFPRLPVLGFLADRLDGQRLVGLDGALPPNVAAVYGLADARAYGPLTPAECARAQAGVAALRAGDLAAEASPLRRRLAELGVRFLLAPPGTAPPAGYRVAFADDTATLLEGAAPPVAHREPHRLRTSMCQDGGWRVLAGRRPHSAAARPFLAVDLPRSARDVALLYRPPGFLAGTVLAALGACLASLLALRPPRVDGLARPNVHSPP